MVGALVGHLVGDFIFQNDYLAHGKKRSSWICLVHVLIYTACVMVFSGWYEHGWGLGSAAALSVAIPHFLIDRSSFIRLWMRVIGQPLFAAPPMAPWSVIVVDNSWHVLCLYGTWKLLAWCA